MVPRAFAIMRVDCNPSSPRAFIREGLSSVGYLHLRFMSLFLGRLALGGLIIRNLQYVPGSKIPGIFPFLLLMQHMLIACPTLL